MVWLVHIVGIPGGVRRSSRRGGVLDLNQALVQRSRNGRGLLILDSGRVTFANSDRRVTVYASTISRSLFCNCCILTTLTRLRNRERRLQARTSNALSVAVCRNGEYYSTGRVASMSAIANAERRS